MYVEIYNYSLTDFCFSNFSNESPCLYLTDAEVSKDMTTNLQDNVVLINMKMFWFVGDTPNSQNLTTILDSRELTENPSIPKGVNCKFN